MSFWKIKEDATVSQFSEKPAILCNHFVKQSQQKMGFSEAYKRAPNE
jgi:hypothetical protein